MSQKRLLIVEDEGIIAADLIVRLERMDYAVVGTAATADEAFANASSLRPDLVLMDIVLQGPQNGITAAKRIKDALDIPIVFLTSHADAATVHSAVGAAPFGYVLKPFNERELQAAIEIGLYRHQTESKLHKMERWLVTTLSSIGDAVIATDIAGLITLINPVAQRLSGWSAEQAVGQPLELVFQAVDATSRAPLTGLVDRALVEGFAIGMDEQVVLLARDGSEVPIDDSIAPIRDDQGQAVGVVIVFRDASARQLAQQAMQSMAESLERQVQERTGALASANRALSSFAASVSHDLRAPLLAVKGLTALLSDRYSRVLDADGLKFLDLLKSKSVQMEGMIDDFLRLFRLRQVPLKSEQVNTQAVVAEVVAALQAQQEQPLRINVAPLPMVTGDAGLIRQVWVNLLSNAVKFTGRVDNPQIQVDGAVNVVDGKDMALFRVTDNGVGFDRQNAATIFEMFQRLHPDREFEGHGVGLAIVQAVVERHGGHVQADGESGRGAVMSFSLPAALAKAG